MPDDLQWTKAQQDRVTELRRRADRLRKADDEMLRSMCQFLSLSEADKLKFLPPIQAGVEYVWSEGGGRTSNPLLYYCNAVLELTDRYAGPRELAPVVLDISSILAVMIEQCTVYWYMWHLDKSIYPITGPSDRLWNVLRRLSDEVIRGRQWPFGIPEIPFEETGYSGVRKSRPT